MTNIKIKKEFKFDNKTIYLHHMLRMNIKDYPNYLIFRNGAVLSKGHGKHHPPRFLKSTKDRKGYCVVNLYHNGKPLTHRVHRLVGLAYIPNTHNYPQIDHINRIRHDNRVSNLRWANDEIQCSNKKERGDNTNNTSGHRNISYYPKNNNWIFMKQKNNIKFAKYFNTLEEAIAFKESFHP
jgi:hypothetical protein